MKAASRVVTTMYVVVGGLLLVWAAWLLATDDPDGGRHPVGAVMLGAAAVSGVVGITMLRRLRKR
jgi:hypothetical protein